MGSAGLKRAQMQSPDVEDLELLSPVPHALMVSGCKNPLLFFDESGESLDGQDQSRSWKVSPQAQLKTMLSDQNRDLRVEALGPSVKVDFSHATIILAGNTAPTNAALRDRFRVIEFPAIPQPQRRTIAATMIAEQPAPEGTSDEELIVMKEFAGQFVNLLLEVDKRHNCPGVRPMAKAISALMCLVRGQLLDGEPLDEKMVNACFSQEYRQEMSREAVAAQNAAASETVPPEFIQGFSFMRPRPNAPNQATASTSSVPAGEIQPASGPGATAPQE